MRTYRARIFRYRTFRSRKVYICFSNFVTHLTFNLPKARAAVLWQPRCCCRQDSFNHNVAAGKIVAENPATMLLPAALWRGNIKPLHRCCISSSSRQQQQRQQQQQQRQQQHTAASYCLCLTSSLADSVFISAWLHGQNHCTLSVNQHGLHQAKELITWWTIYRRVH